VPIHAVNSYVRFIRQALSKDTLEAEALSKRLSNVLEGAWSAMIDASPLNISNIIKSFQPRRVALSEIAAEYLALKQIDQTPPRVALSTFLSLAGDLFYKFLKHNWFLIELNELSHSFGLKIK
jgi:hypothetical protein